VPAAGVTGITPCLQLIGRTWATPTSTSAAVTRPQPGPAVGQQIPLRRPDRDPTDIDRATSCCRQTCRLRCAEGRPSTRSCLSPLPRLGKAGRDDQDDVGPRIVSDRTAPCTQEVLRPRRGLGLAINHDGSLPAGVPSGRFTRPLSGRLFNLTYERTLLLKPVF